MRVAHVSAPWARGHTALIVLGVLTLASALLAWPVTLRIRAGLDEFERAPLPAITPIHPLSVFVDDAPVQLTITAGVEKVEIVATHDAVRSDATLWRRMDIRDWNTVPLPLRTEGLDAMLARFSPLVLDPGAWDRLQAIDWDPVPQPVRALAFRHMAEYWTGYYQVGAEYGVARWLVADTLEATSCRNRGSITAP